jgi:hypothetical protein
MMGEWSVDYIIIGRGKPKYSETLSNKNTMWMVLELNPVLRVEKAANNGLSYGEGQSIFYAVCQMISSSHGIRGIISVKKPEN